MELSVWGPSLAPPAVAEWSFPFKEGSNHIYFDWHPTLPRLAFAYADDLRIVEFGDQGEVLELHRSSTQRAIRGIAWGPNDERLAVASGWAETSAVSLVGLDDSGAFVELQRWDLPNDSQFLDLAWAPDGKHLALSTKLGALLMFDLNSHGAKRLSGHAVAVEAVAWHPGGRRLASASRDGTVRLWDTSSGQLVAKLMEGDPVLALAWDDAGARLAAVTDLGAVHIFDASISLGLNSPATK